MAKLREDNVKYVNKWKKKYQWTGRLNVEDCKSLMQTLEAKSMTRKGIKKRKIEEELQCAKQWVKESLKRQEGKKKREAKQLVEEEIMAICRKEDNETGPVLRRREVENSPAEAKVHAKVEPPPYQEAQKALEETIKETKHIEEKSRQPYCLRSNMSRSFNEKDAQILPMIQVANPNVQAEQPFVLVHRPWTAIECEGAVGMLPSYKEDVEEFITQMEQLRNTYYLNGYEMAQAFQAALKIDWGKVRGNYTGRRQNGDIVPYNDLEMQTILDPVYATMRVTFQRRANYGALAGIKQKDEETVDDFAVRFEKEFRVHSGIPYSDDNNGPYQQQLKNAFMQSYKPEIAGYIRKHFVAFDTANVNELKNWARHAEKVSHDKKKSKKSTPAVYVLDPSLTETFYHGPLRGQGNRRGRGGNRG
ncbi:MAG: hypothetical protein ACRCW5_09645 [Cetobacterium sp.]|uniref:hypothetical protein n=1 Tax=Cetobacterium sp. TaxID=2071632 RepID=UPI003F374BF2